MLAATLGGSAAAPIVVASEAPPWIGALDVLVVAGDDPGDPRWSSAAATGVRRGARVVVAAPYEGPLRDATAGRSVVLAPRLWVPDDFGLARYLAAGLAVLQAVDPACSVDLAALADELDAEALRNSAGRELFTNPAKALAERMSGRDVVLAGDNAATLALARHAAAVMLRIAHQAVAAVGLADALVALRTGIGAQSDADREASMFHDEEIDGPLPRAGPDLRADTDAERPVVTRTGRRVRRRRRGQRRGCAGALRDAPVRSRASRATIGDAGRAVGDGGHLPETGSRLAECTCYAERCGPTRGVRGPPLPNSPDGQVPQRIPRRSCGSARTPATRRGWRPTTASVRCSTRCATIPRVSWARRCVGASATRCRSWSRCSPPTNRCRCRPIRAPSRRSRGSPARTGCGIPVSAPIRNYRDRSHKPELLVALGTSRRWPGSGRPRARVELMRALAVTDLDPFVNLLAGQPDADGLRALFTTWITAPQPDLDVLVPAVIDGAIDYVRSGAKEFAAEAKTVLELGERYPGDAGVLAALLLNRISLDARRGASTCPPATCTLPARRRCRGDGQLRQRVARRADPQARRRPRAAAGARLHAGRPRRRCARRITQDGIEFVYDTPAPEFAVSVLRIDGDHLGHEIDAPSRHDGPQILLCTEGSAVVHAKSSAVTLERGAAAWVAADDGPIRLVAAAARPSCSAPPSASDEWQADVERAEARRDPGGAARQRGHRGGEVRRLPDHRQLVDAGRGGALGRRHVEPGSAAVRSAPGHARKPTRCISSGTAAAATSTRSWWRWCCSPSARSSRCTRATTRSSTRDELTSPVVAIVILVVAIGLESYSFRTAMVESRPLKGTGSWWRFIRNSRNPELPVVLLEDTGALVGLVFALAGVGLTVLTGEPGLGRHRHRRASACCSA